MTAARQSNEEGRFSTYWSRAGGEGLNTIMVEEDLTKTTLNLSGTPYNIWYTCPRDTRSTCLLDPYDDTVAGKPVLMTTISQAAAGGWQSRSAWWVWTSPSTALQAPG